MKSTHWSRKYWRKRKRSRNSMKKS